MILLISYQIKTVVSAVKTSGNGVDEQTISHFLSVLSCLVKNEKDTRWGGGVGGRVAIAGDCSGLRSSPSAV